MKLLRHQADLGPGGAIVADDVVAVDLDLAAGGGDDPAHDADQGRLAGAVGAEQGEDLALGDVEADAFQRLMPAVVALRQVADGDDGGGCGVRHQAHLPSPQRRLGSMPSPNGCRPSLA